MDVRVRLGRLGPGEPLQLLCSPRQWAKIVLLIDPERFDTSVEAGGDLVQASVRRRP